MEEEEIKEREEETELRSESVLFVRLSNKYNTGEKRKSRLYGGCVCTTTLWSRLSQTWIPYVCSSELRCMVAVRRFTCVLTVPCVPCSIRFKHDSPPFDSCLFWGTNWCQYSLLFHLQLVSIGAHGPNHQWYELDAASQKSLNLDPASTEHPCWSREDGDASREALAKALNLGTDDWGGHEVRPYTEKV